ncbi:hypothetical protein CN692_03070 [Bacillus sp. AFS002410]|uniref:hypothetical protein n=1 Tax=Bacillus sp. AFS002410 TaxID=2033481 RepID=UPI000BF03ECA|nr:hypothetical protein [Bacillus sp. AFS002410]PEJ60289.1 hypothetical protein CN692_03070 [Bacillus sp. AFS002410]
MMGAAIKFERSANIQEMQIKKAKVQIKWWGLQLNERGMQIKKEVQIKKVKVQIKWWGLQLKQ